MTNRGPKRVDQVVVVDLHSSGQGQCYWRAGRFHCRERGRYAVEERGSGTTVQACELHIGPAAAALLNKEKVDA